MAAPQLVSTSAFKEPRPPASRTDTLAGRRGSAFCVLGRLPLPPPPPNNNKPPRESRHIPTPFAHKALPLGDKLRDSPLANFALLAIPQGGRMQGHSLSPSSLIKGVQSPYGGLQVPRSASARDDARDRDPVGSPLALFPWPAGAGPGLSPPRRRRAASASPPGCALAAAETRGQPSIRTWRVPGAPSRSESSDRGWRVHPPAVPGRRASPSGCAKALRSRKDFHCIPATESFTGTGIQRFPA